MNAEKLLEEHGDALYAYARSRLQADDDIADVIQETLLAAIKNAAGFKGKSAVRTWLIGILKYKIMDFYRHKAREVTHAPVDWREALEYFDGAGHWQTERAPREWENSPLETMERAELQEQLYRCIAQLPATMRIAITLRELEDCDTATICRELSVTPNNLNVILYRARMHLRQCLENIGFRGVA